MPIEVPFLPADQNLDPLKQDWGEAYKELAALIRAKVPAIKHVDLYYGQEQFIGSDGNWMPFRAPAVFLEFRAAEVQDLGDQVQQLTMDIGVYLLHETVQDTDDRSLGQRRAMEFVGLLRQLHAALHSAQGTHFMPLGRTELSRAEAPPFCYFYRQTYRCVIIDNGAVPQWNWKEPPLEPVVESE